MSSKSSENSNKSGTHKSTKRRKKEDHPKISYLTLYRFASNHDKILIIIALTTTFLAALTLPYSITMVANLFQSMIDYDRSVKDGRKDSEKFFATLRQFGFEYSCVGAIFFVGGYLGSAFMNITAINQIYKIRTAYLRAALNQDFSYYDLTETKDFSSKMADDILKVEEGIGDKVAALVYNSTITIGCVTMAILKGWKLALLCLTTAPVSFILMGLAGKLAGCLSKKEAIQSGCASAVAEEVMSSVRTVYAFNGQQKELLRYQIPLAKVRKIYIKKEFYNGVAMGLLYLCTFLSYAVAFYCGINLILNDPVNYDADVMFSVFMGVMTGMATFAMMASLAVSLGSARGAGIEIFRLLDKVPKINPLLDRGIKPDTIEGNLELKNVVFNYPSRPDVSVLRGISLTVKRGQSLALVGHSGCGKSTIIQLVSRYYDVDSGSLMVYTKDIARQVRPRYACCMSAQREKISAGMCEVRVDGHDVRELSVQWLRAQIGLVGQEPVLFNTTVRENIRYGREDASNADIEAAAKQANAHQFIMKLPKGYETLVGESGASLSGGQKQRIAIARALVRNPRILLLDEATSALDTASEAKVQQALDTAAEGRTTLVVAHRLSTIRNADEICVLKDGEVVEKGNHDELMKLKGCYHNMVEIQDPYNADSDDDGKEPARDQSVVSKMSKTSKASEGKYEEDESAFPTLSETEVTRNPPPLSFCSIIRLNAPEWKSITIGSLCSVINGFSIPLFIVVFGDLFGTMSESDSEKLMAKVNRVVIVCVGIGLLLGSTGLIESVSFGMAGAYLTERLRLRMFEHLLRQPVAYFDNRANSTGALCTRLSLEAAYVQGATGPRIGVILQGVGCITLALTLAMYYEWRVGLVAMSFTPLVAFVIYYQSKATGKECFGNAQSLESSTKVALDAVSNIRTVASLGREKQFIEEYESLLKPALGPAKKSAHLRGVVCGVSRSMFNFMNAAALSYAGYVIVYEGVPYANVLITTQSLQMASGQAQGAFTYAPDIQKGVGAAARVVELLRTKPTMTDPEHPAVTDFKARGEIEFREVEFMYPTRPGVRVLRGLDFQVDCGKTIALVGQSGCGKSTVVKLLLRYYDPIAGVVALDKIPLSQLRSDELRRNLGLVSQEPVLFDRTIADNIAYGDNARTPTQIEIEQAAKEANIHNFIVSLPEGYETNIGSKGMQLSGGQKQRVAIARALIRRPKILLLDEATSALDSESEKLVQEALDRAKEGRTCVMIAHRLSTVRDADVICVVHDGRIAEMGTHTELMDLKKLYYRLHTKGP